MVSKKFSYRDICQFGMNYNFLKLNLSISLNIYIKYMLLIEVIQLQFLVSLSLAFSHFNRKDICKVTKFFFHWSFGFQVVVSDSKKCVDEKGCIKHCTFSHVIREHMHGTVYYLFKIQLGFSCLHINMF